MRGCLAIAVMKYLLVIFALFVGNIFSNDEFPIKLTCEVHNSIIYLNLNKTKVGSWYKPHFSVKDVKYYPYKKGVGKENPFKFRYEISDAEIEVDLGGSTVNRHPLVISRYSLTFASNLSGSRCYKGFKEYKKQV